ncbi:MAG: SAM-dependent methyltransferase, partial [Mycobacterium sp.]|nr:SAM-dependent methyltransferase [Mycobacterium sp.]
MDTAVLDPLAPTPRGVWSGGGVLVRRRRGPHRPHRTPDAVCTERFCAQRAGDSLIVEHDLSPGELCDGLTV